MEKSFVIIVSARKLRVLSALPQTLNIFIELSIQFYHEFIEHFNVIYILN